MGKIRVDEEKLRGESRLLETRIEELGNLNSSLNTLLSRMGDSWEGEASTAYICMMQNYEKKAEEMKEILREFKNYVDQAADKFESTDRNAAARLRSSF